MYLRSSEVPDHIGDLSPFTRGTTSRLVSKVEDPSVTIHVGRALFTPFFQTVLKVYEKLV